MKTNDMKQGFLDEIVWKSSPIFKNNLILKQLGIAIGIPFGCIGDLFGLPSEHITWSLTDRYNLLFCFATYRHCFQRYI